MSATFPTTSRFTLLGAAAILAMAVVAGPAHAAEPAPPTPNVTPAPAAEGVVNINQASADELMRLPGIGATKAELVIAYRTKHEFKRVIDLARVKGIGPKTVQRLKPWLSLSGPTTLREKLKLPRKTKEG